MTKLELVNLYKQFDRVTAVDGVNLKISAGGLVALLGPSGCGKTTTLRMIAGLEKPSNGDILFDGKSVLNIPTEKRNIGMVFQRYVLFPHMNVFKNVSFGLRMRRIPKAEIAKRVDEVLSIVQLRGLEKRFPNQLSGGQQQRVAIARTVITSPKVMLMDEPLSNLDAKLREEMRNFISSLHRRLGITTLFVTHDQDEAIELADQIAIMFEGKLWQFGTPEEVFNYPKTPRIADFMGATNLIKGKLIRKDPLRSILRTPIGDLCVANVPPQPENSEVLVTVRPEHINLSQKDDVKGVENCFTVKVKEVLYNGGIVRYQVEAAGISLQIRDLSVHRFSEGEEVVAKIAKEHLWIFPEE